MVTEPFFKSAQMLEDVQVLIELSAEEGGLDEASKAEVESTFESVEASLRELEVAKMLSGELDSGDCYVEINAGAGGTEACDWVGILARMYTRYFQDRGFDFEMTDFTDGDGAGYRSISYEVQGSFSYGFLKAEIGIHRLVRISPFDANKKRHTSFASVYVYPVIDEDIDVEVRTEDLRVDTYRASGAGGQHVNKTNSAVRMTHAPSGIVVQCQAERSQIRNRERAMKMLKARLYEMEIQKRQAEADKENSEKREIAWGSQIRNYVLQPYQLIKDVRTKYESSNVQKVLDGDIQPFIESYLMMSTDTPTQTS